MTITFDVSDVARGREPMAALDRSVSIPALLSGGKIVEQRFAPAPPAARSVEAYSSSEARLVCANDANALAQAAHDAFYLHHPLVISPDAVWFTLAQGFATHVARNAEELRSRCVRHEGKKKLKVVRPDFFLGQPNPWPEAFAAFSDQIAEHVGKLRDLVVCDLSTTGPIERAASEVLVMDTFQAYFEYEMICGCGIPAITLLGTPDDWRSVRTRAAMLSEFGLERWTDALLPVLDEIVRTSEGKVDRGFWRSFFRYDSGSGPSELTGWILTLFPYIKVFERANGWVERLVPNPHLATWEQELRVAETRKSWPPPDAPALNALPCGIASAPVNFVDVRDGSEHPLRFVAGLFGVTQDATNALAPEFGWAIVHEPAD